MTTAIPLKQANKIRSNRSPETLLGTKPTIDAVNIINALSVAGTITAEFGACDNNPLSINGASNAVPAKLTRARSTNWSVLEIAKKNAAPANTPIANLVRSIAPAGLRDKARSSAPSANNCESAVDMAAAVKPTATSAAIYGA